MRGFIFFHFFFLSFKKKKDFFLGGPPWTPVCPPWGPRPLGWEPLIYIFKHCMHACICSFKHDLGIYCEILVSCIEMGFILMLFVDIILHIHSFSFLYFVIFYISKGKLRPFYFVCLVTVLCCQMSHNTVGLSMCFAHILNDLWKCDVMFLNGLGEFCFFFSFFFSAHLQLSSRAFW